MVLTRLKELAKRSVFQRWVDRVSLAACVSEWLCAVSIATSYAIHFAQRFPYADDWNMVVPVLARIQPFNIEWLWSQYNEHRIFIPRLAFVLLGRIDHGDFRAPVLLDVAALAVISVLFIVAARRRRGASSVSDCFFPFMLLHLLQSSVFWGAQFQFISSTLLFSIGAFVIVANERLSSRDLAVISLVFTLLPLCGGNGLALAPPLGVWLLVHGIYRLRRGERSEGLVAGLGASALAGLSIGYLVNWHAIPKVWNEPTLASATEVALQLAAAGFGPVLAPIWPVGGIVVGLLFVLAAVVLVRDVRREGVGGRAFALSSLVLATVFLAETIGWSRSGRGQWPLFFEYHYAPLALPIPCVLYLVSLSYGANPIGTVARWTLFVIAGALYCYSLPRGAHPHVAEMAAFEADMASGASAHELVARHIHLLATDDTPEERANIERGLQGLFDAGYYRASNKDTDKLTNGALPRY